jgi:hypothetical protein
MGQEGLRIMEGFNRVFDEWCLLFNATSQEEKAMLRNMYLTDKRLGETLEERIANMRDDAETWQNPNTEILRFEVFIPLEKLSSC